MLPLFDQECWHGTDAWSVVSLQSKFRSLQQTPLMADYFPYRYHFRISMAGKWSYSTVRKDSRPYLRTLGNNSRNKHPSVITENIQLGPVLTDRESVTTESCSLVSPFLRVVVTEPSRMKSVRTEGCHVGLFREFIRTAFSTYKQSNTTIHSQVYSDDNERVWCGEIADRGKDSWRLEIEVLTAEISKYGGKRFDCHVQLSNAVLNIICGVVFKQRWVELCTYVTCDRLVWYNRISYQCDEISK